jgi:hypothetical protein
MKVLSLTFLNILTIRFRKHTTKHPRTINLKMTNATIRRKKSIGRY